MRRTEAGREAQVDGGPLVESLRDQVAYLREIVATRDEEIRRRDVIISQLTNRIPEIEAPRGTPGSPESGAEAPGPETGPPDQQTPSERRPWWVRWFGGGDD